MSQKRQPDDGKAQFEENSSSDDKRRRVRNVFMEAMRMHSVQNFLEPLLRRVVKEEVELALRKHLNNMKRNSDKVVHPSKSSNLQLQFSNSLSLPVFTGTRIEAEDCSTIRITLIDALTGKIVDQGPISSAKVEIVVLEGDFEGDEGDNWTLEEFKNNIVKEREGKKPLLMGEVFLNLKEGVGVVDEISFTDNSSWTRSRKFRLGARVVDNSNDTRIREAKSESFIVRDHRGELYKKHHPPSLLDEVWRLEKIGKEGAFHKRLSRENITTVRDFLTLFFIDPSRLRNILGSGMSAKMWEVTVEHARTCTLDKRIFLYSRPASQPKTSVVFNVVGQLMGLLLEQHQYAPVDKLSETEKAEAQTLVISAFKHWEEVVSFDDEASLFNGSSSHSPNVIYPSTTPTTEVSSDSKSMFPHKMGKIGSSQPSPSSPDIVSSIYSIDECTLQGIDNMDLRYDPPYSFPTQVTNSISSMICDIESMTQGFYDDDHLGFFESECSLQNPCLGSPSDLHLAVDKFRFASSTPVAIDKAQRRWRMLFNVLKWFSLRRHVASKKGPIREIQRCG